MILVWSFHCPGSDHQRLGQSLQRRKKEKNGKRKKDTLPHYLSSVGPQVAFSDNNYGLTLFVRAEILRGYFLQTTGNYFL